MRDQVRLERLVVGVISTNCYLLENKETGKVIVIDPGGGAEHIRRAVQMADAEPEAILLTHGHTDHLMAVGKLRGAWPDVKLYVPKEEREVMEMSQDILPGVPLTITGEPDVWVSGGDVLRIGGFSLTVIATPGHTKGSVCYYDEEDGLLFSGDTLFSGSCGRVDLPTGSAREMRRSLTLLRDTIPDEVQVLPGHMHTSVMAEEKRYNPYLLQA